MTKMCVISFLFIRLNTFVLLFVLQFFEICKTHCVRTFSYFRLFHFENWKIAFFLSSSVLAPFTHSRTIHTQTLCIQIKAHHQRGYTKICITKFFKMLRFTYISFWRYIHIETKKTLLCTVAIGIIFLSIYQVLNENLA